MARVESLAAAVRKLEAILDPGLRREVSPCTASHIEDMISKMSLVDVDPPMKQSWEEFQVLVQKLEKWDHADDPLLSRDEFGCFIWGPMRFLLEVAQTDIEIFGRLLDAYSKIGQGIVDLVEGGEEFEAFAHFTQLCDEYLSEVLDFHSEALGLLRHSGFDALFRPKPKQSHEKLQEVLENESSDHRPPKRCKLTTESDHEIQEADERHKLAMSELKVKLQSPDYRRDHEGFIKHRIEFDSGTWIFSEAKFQSWYRSTDNTILCISGLPGMGKTVLMSTVANKLLAEKQDFGSEVLVGYFYFSSGLQDPHNSLLRALLQQFMDQNETLLSELVDEHLHAYADRTRESEMLQLLIKRAMEAHRTTFLILDGLDEYTHKEIGPTRFDLYPSISLERSAHTKDVRRYCDKCCREIQDKFGLMPEKGEEIAKRVAKLSNDNFLYARVLLGHVLSYPATSNPGTALWPSIFPGTMIGVCQWIMNRLHGSEDGLKLLGLLLAAERPLRWREAQALLCIDAENSTVSDSSRDRSIQAREFCGGVVDVYRVAGDGSCSEEMIRILHAKVKEYLSADKPGMINMRFEHGKLSRFCSKYLTSERFRASLYVEGMTWEDIEFYEPLDYTVQHWYHHAKATIEAYTEGFEDEFSEAIDSLGTFLWVYMREASYWNGKRPESPPGVIELFKHIHEDEHECNSQLRLESRVGIIRKKIESLYWSHEGVSPGLDGSGQQLILKCPKPWCSFFTGSFGTIKERDIHLERHQRPFYCASQDCFAHELGFESLQGLYCHQWRAHQPVYLLESPKPSPHLHPTLEEATSLGDPMVVKEVLSSIPFRGSTLTATLCMAASRGFQAVCELLISKGADINGSGDESVEGPVEAAASRGDADMLKLFLRWDVHPATLSKALDMACKNGHYRAARLLVEANKSGFADTNALLLRSIQSGSLPLTEYLLDQGLGYYIDGDLVNSIMDTFEQIQHGYEVLELALSVNNGILNGRSIESAIKRGLIREVELMLRYPKLQFDDICVDQIWAAALDAKSTELVSLLLKVKTVDALPEGSIEEATEWYNMALLAPQEMDNNIDDIIDDNTIREWTGQ